jgi:hypothetical protein
MKWLQTRDWNVLCAKIIAVCGLFTTGGMLVGVISPRHAAAVQAAATLIIALLRPVTDPAEKTHMK